MYDTIKADLRFGLYRYAETEMERHVAGLVDEQYEDDLMCRLTRSRRVIGCVEALRLRDLAEFAAARPSKKFGERFSEWAADEVAVAMRWTRNMAFAQLHLAVTVTNRLPGTLAALSRGELDLRGVQAMAEITDPLDDATAKAVEDAVLPKAGEKNTSELRRAARRAVLRLDPAGAQERHEKRRQERHVELTPLEDAMAELRAYLPAPDATAIYHRLNDFAHAAPPDDTRTMDQRRADTFTDLLLGTPITTNTAGSGDDSTAGPGNTDDGNVGNTDDDPRASTDDAASASSSDDDQNANSRRDGSDAASSDGATCGTSSDDVTDDHQDAGNPNTNSRGDDSRDSDAGTSNGGHDGNDANATGGATGGAGDGEATGGNHDARNTHSGDANLSGSSHHGSGASSSGVTGGDQDASGNGGANNGASNGRGGRVGRAGTTKTLVRVTVPISTLMGLDDAPGELAGYGPIPAGIARDIAAGGTWKRLLTDPVSGTLLDYGRTTYRPPAGLADFVRARDHHCVFPGCSRPADACDIDHRTAYPDGPTSEDNLECLCRHHHRLKHEAGWTVEYHNGVHIWTTPDGHRYHRQPHPIAAPTLPAPPPPVEPPPF